jgi:hypothetical protein
MRSLRNISRLRALGDDVIMHLELISIDDCRPQGLTNNTQNLAYRDARTRNPCQPRGCTWRGFPSRLFHSRRASLASCPSLHPPCHFTACNFYVHYKVRRAHIFYHSHTEDSNGSCFLFAVPRRQHIDIPNLFSSASTLPRTIYCKAHEDRSRIASSPKIR